MARWEDKQGNGRPPSWRVRPQSLNAEIDAIERSHATDLTLARILMRLYWNLPITTRSLPNISAEQDIERYATAANRIANQFGFNLMRDLMDAMVARVCRQMSCKVITVGGDANLHTQSAKMARFLDGMHAENDARELFERVFIDAGTGRGFGAAKVYFDPIAEEVKLARVDNMGVFFRYSAGDKPRELFTRTPVPREYLQDTYPKKADALAKISADRRTLIVGVEPIGAHSDDTVMVNEGWSLHRGDKDPGRWVMTCGQVVLENEPYPYDFHQLVLFRIFPEYLGAGGVSLSRIGAAYHRWENQLVRIAHDSFRGNVPRVVQHEATTINEGGVSDVPYSKLIWSGTVEPKIEASNPVSDQLLRFLPTIRHQAHVDTGVNEAMASGLKPTGINSGAALREYRDFADSRLNGPNERWADLWARVGKAEIGIAAEHYKNKSVCVRAPGAKMLTEIKWNDIDLKKNKFRLLFEASSGLSTGISARMQQVSELQALGGIDNIEVIRLVANVVPDVAAEADRITGPRDLAIQMCEEALEGNPQHPSSFYGQEFLNDVVRIGTQMMARAEFAKNRTPEQMECLRKLLRAAMRKQAKPLPPARFMPAAAPMSPDSIVPVGVAPTALGPQIARNRFEAASMGMAVPGTPSLPPEGQPG